MSALLNKARTLIPNNNIIFQPKRFRGKINIQKPRAPHYERARIIKLTEPYFPSKRKHLSPLELCSNFKAKVIETEEVHPYQKIIARECLNWFNHSPLIALFHLNPMNSEERFAAFVAYKKSNMHLWMYGRKTLEVALANTKYEVFAQNIVSQNILVFSSEPNIKQLLKIGKKFPQMILLSAIFEGRYLSKDELLKYSQIPDITAARAQFVQTLQSVSGQFVQRLTQQQNNLATLLGQRVEQLKDSSDS